MPPPFARFLRRPVLPFLAFGLLFVVAATVARPMGFAYQWVNMAYAFGGLLLVAGIATGLMRLRRVA